MYHGDMGLSSIILWVCGVSCAIRCAVRLGGHWRRYQPFPVCAVLALVVYMWFCSVFDISLTGVDNFLNLGVVFNR